MKKLYKVRTVFKEGCPLVETLYRRDIALSKVKKNQANPYVAKVEMEVLVLDEESGEWRPCGKQED